MSDDDLEEFGLDKAERKEDAPVVPMGNPSALTFNSGFDAGLFTAGMKGVLDSLKTALDSFSDSQDELRQEIDNFEEKLDKAASEPRSYLTAEEIEEFSRGR